MYSFDEIVADALTSDEEVHMVNSARIGAEQDIQDMTERIVTDLDEIRHTPQLFLYQTDPSRFRHYGQ
jgi:hypothetical protein